MADRTVAILGGSTGGLLAARRLRRLLDPGDRVVLIDRSATYHYAPSFLWVMTGARRPEQVTRDLRTLRRRGIEVVIAEVRAVDTANRGALGQPGCQPPSPIDSPASGPGPEVEGTSPNAELWALLFASPPIHAGDEVKIVWRMTGSGALRIAAMGPAGTAARLTFGPQQHSGSNWTRPGDEWGTGFVFPSPGCWDIHAARDNATGDVWLLVQ